MPFVLTLRNLIRSAQSAIQAGELGLQRGHTEPRFVYEDGSVCLVSAAFSGDVLARIVENGDVRCNWISLMRAGYFDIAGRELIEALTTFQLAYDFACGADATKIQRLLRYVLSLHVEMPPSVWPCEYARSELFA